MRFFYCLFFIFSTSISYAKPLKHRFGSLEKGKVPANKIKELEMVSTNSHKNISPDRYAEIVINPRTNNEEERLAAMTGREFFLLVDRSGSMGMNDKNPTVTKKPNKFNKYKNKYLTKWTRWDSARLAAESLAEIVLSLDRDNVFKVMLWNDDFGFKSKYKDVRDINKIKDFFKKYNPSGGTPMAKALKDVYENYLERLLNNREPFTVIILTDGAPNDENKVIKFFTKLISKHRLAEPGREYLAAFSFVRMGDDPGAMRFLQTLDDDLPQRMNWGVDIIDTKEDNYLFGTGKYKYHNNIGPFALLWDAIFD